MARQAFRIIRSVVPHNIHVRIVASDATDPRIRSIDSESYGLTRERLRAAQAYQRSMKVQLSTACPRVIALGAQFVLIKSNLVF